LKKRRSVKTNSYRNLYILIVHISVYKMLINKKDLIRINQEIGEQGNFANEASLDFALSMLKERKSWLYTLSYLVRCILIDHVFRDGNKRTAFTLICTVLDEQDMAFDGPKMYLGVMTITKKNMTNPLQIMRVIKNGIIPNTSTTNH